MQFYKYLYVVFFLFFLWQSNAQVKTIDSLQALVNNSLHDCRRADLLLKLGSAYLSSNLNELAIRYGKQSLDLSTNLSCKKNLLPCYKMLGIAFDDNGNYPEARKHFELGLNIAIKQNDAEQKSVFYTNLGETCRSQADYSKALEYFLNALKIDEETESESRLVSDYFTLTLLFGNLDEASQQKKYLFKALHLSKKIKNKRVEAKCYNIYANLLGDEGKIDSALLFYQKGLELAREIKLKHLEAKILSNIGGIFKSKCDYENALIYTNYSVKINSEIGDYKFLAADYVSLGWIYSQMNNLKESRIYFLKALDLATHKFIDSEINAYKGMALMNAKSKQFEEAYKYHVKYKALDDSIYNTDNSKQLGDIKTNFEVEKKENELKAEQEKFKAISVEEKKQQRIIIIAVICVLFVVLIFSFFLFKRYKLTNKQKRIIEVKNQQTELQKQLIEEKQKEIIDSINYAKRIQNAILPQANYLNAYIPNNFVLYQPKDIIAGDFYWMYVSPKSSDTHNELIFIAAADSTGHGVPGTLVSIVCSNALDKSVKEFGLRDVGEILDKTTELVIEAFAKSGEEISDGMDISLLCIDKVNQSIYWSGANNQLLYAFKGKLSEIKPNKQPIGKSEICSPFKTHHIPYCEGTIFYLMTDGYRDQFGGPNGKKFKYRQLEELITQNCNLPLQQQLYTFEEVFSKWKGNLDQVDDVTIIGVKI